MNKCVLWNTDHLLSLMRVRLLRYDTDTSDSYCSVHDSWGSSSLLDRELPPLCVLDGLVDVLLNRSLVSQITVVNYFDHGVNIESHANQVAHFVFSIGSRST